MLRRGGPKLRRGSPMLRRGSQMLRRGSPMLRRGTVTAGLTQILISNLRWFADVTKLQAAHSRHPKLEETLCAPCGSSGLSFILECC